MTWGREGGDVTATALVIAVLLLLLLLLLLPLLLLLLLLFPHLQPFISAAMGPFHNNCLVCRHNRCLVCDEGPGRDEVLLRQEVMVFDGKHGMDHDHQSFRVTDHR